MYAYRSTNSPVQKVLSTKRLWLVQQFHLTYHLKIRIEHWKIATRTTLIVV